ncbi:MAG TPA: orotidine-5'-phosphate decarboxylase [Granulicella sp.]
MQTLEQMEEQRIDLSDPKERLIVALDFPSAAPARELLQTLDGACRWVKIGMELYYAEGNLFLAELHSADYKVFLDLKLHDIPNTVASAIRALAGRGASLLNVHASGGPVMLAGAAEASKAPGSPKLLAVTTLTSMDAAQLAAVGVPDLPKQQVLRLARLAYAAGVRGLVCSAEETESLRAEFGDDLELVVPGIRPSGSAVNDQKRIATPGDAIRRGASRLVVGRPITRSSDPKTTVASILEEIAAAI